MTDEYGSTPLNSHPLTSATDAYYESHAQEYFERTHLADLSSLYEPFLSRLHSGARILDAGAGSGRDLRVFKKRGFDARGIDASPSLSRLAEQFSGAPCVPMRIEELNTLHSFDGIWACASLLHIPKSTLPQVLNRFRAALVPGGTVFASMQEGQGEGCAGDGRLYALFQSDELLSVFANAGFIVDRIWRSQDVLREESTAPRWLNIIATSPRTGSIEHS